MSTKWESKRFLAQETENQSNNHQRAGIGKKKLFLELDEHHIKKVGIKRFLAQEAKMNVTAISSLPIGKNKIFHELDVNHV